jgi:regulator of ribonuclease activity A
VQNFSGQVDTLRCFEDNSLVRKALGQPGEGRILVVDGGTSMRVALLGDQLGALAVQNGWTGIVIEGCVRDTAALRELPIGIRALGANPRRSIKRGQGQHGVMLRLGRMDVRSGWWLYADDDGIVVLPHEAEFEA